MDHRVHRRLHRLNRQPETTRQPLLGNPLRSESAAFRWVIAVMVGALCVGLVAKLVSPVVAIALTLVLAGIVMVMAIKGIRGMLKAPAAEDGTDEQAADRPPE